MKKLLTIILAVAMVLSLFTGCGKQTETAAPAAETKTQAVDQMAPSGGGSLVIWINSLTSESRPLVRRRALRSRRNLSAPRTI